LLLLVGVVIGFLAGGVFRDVSKALADLRALNACENAQHDIVLALRRYAEQHAALPESLDALAVEGLIGKGHLYCSVSNLPYLYVFEGLHVSPDALEDNTCVLVCRKAPHGQLVPYARWSGHATSVKVGELVGHLEHDRVRLVELLEPRSHGGVLKRLLGLDSPSSSANPADAQGVTTGPSGGGRE
jgi:hypothetical protein